MIAILRLPYPPSVNNYWRFTPRGVYVTKKGKEFQQTASTQARQQWARNALYGPVEVQLFVTPPDKRRRDIDNIIKPTLDALTVAGVWRDDKQVSSIKASWYGKPAKPGEVSALILPHN